MVTIQIRLPRKIPNNQTQPTRPGTRVFFWIKYRSDPIWVSVSTPVRSARARANKPNAWGLRRRATTASLAVAMSRRVTVLADSKAKPLAVLARNVIPSLAQASVAYENTWISCHWVFAQVF